MFSPYMFIKFIFCGKMSTTTGTVEVAISLIRFDESPTVVWLHIVK